eukprot:1276838-Karenia_brevis.AAC.1
MGEACGVGGDGVVGDAAPPLTWQPVGRVGPILVDILAPAAAKPVSRSRCAFASAAAFDPLTC